MTLIDYSFSLADSILPNEKHLTFDCVHNLVVRKTLYFAIATYSRLHASDVLSDFELQNSIAAERKTF